MTDTYRPCRRPQHPPVAALRVVGSRRLIKLDGLITRGDYITIGRTRQRNIRLNHSSISREHCRITRNSKDDYTILDQHSKNGVWVARFGPNDEYLAVKRRRLVVGMHIQLGELTLVVCDKQGNAPILATRYSEFLRIACAIYGTAAEGARQLGRRSRAMFDGIARRIKRTSTGDDEQ